MEDPDVVEIASPPPLLASGSRTCKPRKGVVVTNEVIDVEKYEFRDKKKNKGKAIQQQQQVNSFHDQNPFSHCSEKVIMDLEANNVSSDDVEAVVMNTQSCPRRTIAAAVSSLSPQQVFLRDFKRFDTVDDFGDHYYASKGSASKQHSKNWVKKIQADWTILENDLPETIFVRACESRMDLMRAVIIGAEGTPYHDGLFFFDIQFPATYPLVPPKVYYHSGGLRINPNLYNCGKVCLSLLGTWSGNTREKWIPNESTMLQLLVSIQALILNQEPYFNEPGYESSKGTKSGMSHSKNYSENVFLLSLNTMVYTMRRPPKRFEEFVRSHYYVRAHDIVKACDGYREGAFVGTMVKGGVQDLEENSECGSKKFMTNVGNYMKMVVDEFVKLGVKELEDKTKPLSESNANTESSKKRSRSSRWFCLFIIIIIIIFLGGYMVTLKSF